MLTGAKNNVSEIRMLRWLSGHTGKHKITNELRREKVEIAFIREMTGTRLRLFGDVSTIVDQM